MRDVMIDLETWGTQPGCIVRSIGAVLFDRNQPPDEYRESVTFSRTIQEISQSAQGLEYDPETVLWWKAPERAEANARLLTDQRQFREVAEEFNLWFVNMEAEYIWCHGATFDVPIWEAACRVFGVSPVWKFYNVRCTRTVYDTYGLNRDKVRRAGLHHDALQDALYQVECVQTAIGGAGRAL